jgi:hypothetical protein
MPRKCDLCELWIIEPEIHACPLEDAVDVNYIVLDGRPYINRVRRGDRQAPYTPIAPIIVPKYIHTT